MLCFVFVSIIIIIIIIIINIIIIVVVVQGLDSDEQTIIKLGRYTFAGKYEHAMGNVVFFEEKEDKQLQYLCHTSKVLKASRVFLKPNNTNKESNN